MPAIVLHISVTDLIGILPDAYKCKVPLIKVKFDNYYMFVRKPFIDLSVPIPSLVKYCAFTILIKVR